jgi:uncharacterized membrane protein YczE
VITKRERRLVLATTVPLLIALACALPFIDNRAALAVATVLLVLSAYLIGAVIAAPVHPNRK